MQHTSDNEYSKTNQLHEPDPRPTVQYPWEANEFCAACFTRRHRSELRYCSGCPRHDQAQPDAGGAVACRQMVTAYYCGKFCQQQHWAQHYKVCPRLDLLGTDPT